MEAKTNLLEPLLEKAEQYSKTSIELIKLRSVHKAADVISSLASRSLLVLVISFFVLTINIAVALWLGDLLGKSYYGFLLVASFYALIGVILLLTHRLIKARVNNAIINQVLN